MDKLRFKYVHKVADFVPARPCIDTLYAPFYLVDPSPVIAGRTELLYIMGGHIDSEQTPGLSSPGRFADKIYYCYRQADGTWSDPEQGLIIQKSFFPWMGNDDFLKNNPETFIGSTAGPNVIKIDRTYYMFFSATVSDPNICTGEHPEKQNVHGSCREPWSYFALFCATSNDGASWTLRDMGRPSPNIALQYAVAYYTPTQADTANGAFKGLAMPHGVIYDGTYLYIFHEFWASVGLRNARLRSADLSHFEIWNGGGWDPVTDGVLPSFINTDMWRGNPYAHIINMVSPTTLVDGYKYILTAQGTGAVFGGTGNNNCIEYALSNDLVNWTPGALVDSGIKHVADGTGGDNSVLNPIYTENDGAYTFLWASNDYNDDGQPDCNGPYPGLAIFEGTQKQPKQTTMVTDGKRHAAGGQQTG